MAIGLGFISEKLAVRMTAGLEGNASSWRRIDSMFFAFASVGRSLMLCSTRMTSG